MERRRFSLFSFPVVLFALFALCLPVRRLWATTVVVNDNGDALNSPGCATTGTGTCTLRDALTFLTANPGTSDEIDFDISGSGVHTITPGSALPDITVPIIIDGYTQSGAQSNTLPSGNNAVLLIELDGTSAGADVNGLHITGGGSVVRGLVINRFTRYGILLETGGNNLLEGNFIGTNPAGDTDRGNTNSGVIVATSAGNTIGGTTPSARNLISGNDFQGLDISGPASINNIVQGNFIGTNAAGTDPLPNSFHGVLVSSQASQNTIGGSVSGAGNLISGNSSSGIEMGGTGVTANIVQGNFIGTDVTGTAAVPNEFLGIEIGDASNNVIGGTVSGARNVISGNNSSGIQVDGDPATGNQILGNFIGTDVTGTLNLANNSNGIGIGSGSTTIGGTTPGAGNVIVNGINLFLGSTDTIVQGNFIGTDVTGTQSLGSVSGGIFIFTSNNTIGGTTPGAGNVIAFNPDFGIATAPNAGGGNEILGNSIFSNDGLGIDLLQDGITANDADDVDTGPNNLQNFPDLSSIVSANGSTTVQGTLDSTAGGNFHIEFFSNDACDPSGNGEGQTFLGTINVPNGSFNAVLPGVLSGPLFITATATDNATKDTSEFSKCIQATVLVENCTNGVDDDGDNLVDCADPDCASDPSCAPSVEICDNNVDDDGDGLADCADPDCAADVACSAFSLSGGGCALTERASGNSIALLIPFLALAVFKLRRKMTMGH